MLRALESAVLMLLLEGLADNPVSVKPIWTILAAAVGAGVAVGLETGGVAVGTAMLAMQFTEGEPKDTGVGAASKLFDTPMTDID